MLAFIDKHWNNEYRFYTFNNMYLSGLQKGLQTAHVVAEMANTLDDVWDAADKQNDFCGLNVVSNANELHIIGSYDMWKKQNKTIIMLDGGNCAALENIYKTFNKFIIDDGVPLAITKFHESGEALNGALTCVGIVLPKCIYEYAAYLRETKDSYPLSFTLDKDMSDAEKSFFKLLNSCRLSV